MVELVLLDDGALDGHAVVVPAGDIGRVVAAHRVGTGDEVLQGLVERVTHVQSAVGERRAVVQGEAGLALVLFEHEVVEVHFLPVLEHLRLALGKTRAHREAGLGHIQRAFVIHVASPLYDKLLLCFLFDHLAGENDQSAFLTNFRIGKLRKRVVREHRRIIVIERPQFDKVGRRFEKPQLLLRPEGGISACASSRAAFLFRISGNLCFVLRQKDKSALSP